MDSPLVSVLMPIKNGLPYLEKCLHSILKQSYKHWELIVVNDHSTDGSAKILDQFSQNDPRITALENKGNGIIAALRTAFAVCKGELISRMDADDLMQPDKLEYMAEQLQQFGPGNISLGLVRYFSDEKELGLGYIQYAQWLNSLSAKGDNWRAIYRECVIPSPCFMLYKDDLQKAGAFDADDYPEDYDLAFRLYKCGFQIIPSHEVLHLWRDHSRRVSRNSIHYSDNRFLELKSRYWLELEQDHRPTAVWGAGKQGKDLIKLLQKKKIKPLWYCDNPKKIGKEIYGIVLQDAREIKQADRQQIIVAVASPDGKREIKRFLKDLGFEEQKDYFFFF